MEKLEKELQKNSNAFEKRYKKAEEIDNDLFSFAKKFGQFLDENQDKIDTSNFEKEAQKIYDDIFGKEPDENINNLDVDQYLEIFTHNKLEEYFLRTIDYLKSTSKGQTMKNKNFMIFLAPFTKFGKIINDLIFGKEINEIPLKEFCFIYENIYSFINEVLAGYEITSLEAKELTGEIDNIYQYTYNMIIAKTIHRPIKDFTHEDSLKYLELLKMIIKKWILDEKIGFFKLEFKPIYQGKFTNSFVKINSEKTKTINSYETDFSQPLLFPLENFEHSENKKEPGFLKLKNPSNNRLSVTSSKLFDIICIELTDKLTYRKLESLDSYLTLDIDVKEYMAMRGISRKDTAVAQLRKDTRALFNAEATITESKWKGTGKNRKKIDESYTIRILDKIPDEKQQIGAFFSVHISLSFAEYLVTHQLMQYPLKLLQKSDNNNVYYIGRKLVEHYNMNKTKRNKDSISVEKLLEATPEIPTLKQEKEKSRHYRLHCIEPLEKVLDQLQKQGLLSEWHFLYSDKKKIPQDDLLKQEISYDEWQTYFVHFKIKGYPDKKRKSQKEES